MPELRKLLSAEQITGARVVGTHGEDLGKIREILIDAANSQIVYAVVSYGGMLNGRQLPVPWEALRQNAEWDAYVLDIPEEKLKNAPEYDRDNLQDIADPRWAEPIHKYYGLEVSWYKQGDAHEPSPLELHSAETSRTIG